MPRARHTQVCLEATPYYHCIARCVRRAFLCGTDAYTGRCYDYRKAWILERLRDLAEVFAIDVCAYAAMSNHLHLVLRIDAERAEGWSDTELMERWQRLFSLPALVTRYQLGESMSKAELDAVFERLSEWRTRLMDLSWFMRCLNEHVARKANEDDGCTGRFWEGRFKSQALLDEAAVLTCMSYVDLNPIRAKMAATPEASDFTSIQARIRALAEQGKAEQKPAEPAKKDKPVPLLIFGSDEHAERPQRSIPFALTDYLELVDWAGRAVREDRGGAIPADIPPILERLNIDPKGYVRHLTRERAYEPAALGREVSLRGAAEAFGRVFFKGLGEARSLFPAPS